MAKRLLTALLCLCFMLGLSICAAADSAASYIQNYAAVNSDGSCDVTLTVNLRLESQTDSLRFPLPREASNIRLDGASVKSSRSGSATWVDLSHLDGLTGERVLRFTYTLEGLVTVQDQQLYLNLPLLSGFSHPVESMKFDVMLPAAFSARPTFTSTYHQDSIESLLTYTVDGNMLTGYINSQLKDNETLSMTLQVTPAMFPSVSTYERTGDPELVPMAVCAVLALVYWLCCLRGAPLLRTRRTTPPEGITAGELGTRLTACGADLTMMVVSWAQLGYLMIHLDDNGRVMLHKRMDMGNERSAFENKVFRSLFGQRRVIDGTGFQYARLCRSVASSVPGQRSIFRPKNGNGKIFRWLCCGTQLFLGLLLAMNLTASRALQVILAILLCGAGALSAWYMQQGMYRLHLRWKQPVLWSLGLGAGWILLSVAAGQWLAGLLSVLLQWLAGLMTAYGGRRSETGRANAGAVLGLRHFLKHISPEEALRLQSNDPDVFYNLLPMALALGVGKAFSQAFGRKKQEQCPYFHCGISSRMNAADWARFLHEAIEILDARQRRLAWEQLLSLRIR